MGPVLGNPDAGSPGAAGTSRGMWECLHQFQLKKVTASSPARQLELAASTQVTVNYCVHGMTSVMRRIAGEGGRNDRGTERLGPWTRDPYDPLILSPGSWTLKPSVLGITYNLDSRVTYHRSRNLQTLLPHTAAQQGRTRRAFVWLHFSCNIPSLNAFGLRFSWVAFHPSIYLECNIRLRPPALISLHSQGTSRLQSAEAGEGKMRVVPGHHHVTNTIFVPFPLEQELPRRVLILVLYSTTPPLSPNEVPSPTHPSSKHQYKPPPPPHGFQGRPNARHVSWRAPKGLNF